MTRKLLLSLTATLTLFFLLSASKGNANDITPSNDTTYYEVPYFDIKSSDSTIFELNFQLTSQSQVYGYDITLSNVTKSAYSNTGSIMGYYNGQRSGYIYTAGSTNTFQACVGDNHRGTKFDISGTDIKTITGEYDASNSNNKTYNIKMTVGDTTSSLSSGTWTGSYATGANFRITSCAGSVEAVSMKVYGINIWTGSTSKSSGTLKVNVVPKTRYDSSSGKYSIGYYDKLEGSGTFHEVTSTAASGGVLTKFTLDKDGGSGGTDAVYGGSNTTYGTFPTVTKINVPTKEGATFTGYYRESDNTQIYDKDGNYVLDNATYSENVTLKAKWVSAPTGTAIGGYYKDGDNKKQVVAFGFTYGDYANLSDGDTFGVYIYSSSSGGTPSKTFTGTDITSLKAKEGRFYCVYDCASEGATYYAKAYVITGGNTIYSDMLSATGSFETEYKI